MEILKRTQTGKHDRQYAFKSFFIAIKAPSYKIFRNHKDYKSSMYNSGVIFTMFVSVYFLWIISAVAFCPTQIVGTKLTEFFLD